MDLGVSDPTDYCQTNPMIITPCFVMGDPLATTGTSKTADALVGFPYANTGGTAPKTFMVEAQYIGTVWAQAYQRDSKTLFSAATVKRHAGLGPGGLDAIYLTDLSNPATPGTPAFIKLSALSGTINVGTIGTNASRDLKPDKKDPSADAEGFTSAGKIGIGGISLSDNQTSLWVLNINENKVHELDLSIFNTSKNKADITFKSTITIPSAGCVSGQQRAWALNYYKGAVYAGSVCDASSGTKSDLRAYVNKYDVATSTWSKVFDFPLTYPKGYPYGGTPDVTGWYPWTDTFSDIVVQSIYVVHPEPMLTDIEFDTDGSMVLAFGDRSGTQGGFRNYDPNGAGDYTSISAGDILRAYSSGGVYILENAAKAGPAMGYGPTNDQGPGFGEFYNDDVYDASQTYHAESSIGGLAIRPGSGEVVNTAMDPLTGLTVPVSDISFSAGVRKYNNTNGSLNSAYRVYQTPDTYSNPSLVNDGTFGKTQGLGDATLGCDLPTYLEIGNRVWIDTDKDGIQDPCEKALAGVTVNLVQAGSTIATVTTDINGEYYFNNNPTSGTATNTASTTALFPTRYSIVFGGAGQYANSVLTVAGGKYTLTVRNTGEGATAAIKAMNDSDALLDAGFPTIKITTGALATVNHTYDAGFYCVPTQVASVSAVKATCTGTTPNSDASINLTGIQCSDKAFLVASGGALPSYTATGSQPVSASAVSFTGLSNPALALGQSYSVVLYNGPCCYTVVTAVLPQQTCVAAPPAVCTITLKPSVSGCYQSGGTSKATVSVEVAWSNAPAGDYIVVTTGGQSRTITPGMIQIAYGFGVSPQAYTIVSPQVVAFEVPANGAAGQVITATFATNLTCAAAGSFDAPAACAPTACAGNNVGGMVFNDFNADGIKQPGETSGIPGVLVSAYDCAGKLVGTALSDPSGAYSITAITPGNYPLRIEFANLPAYAGMGTPNGTNGRTTVQFVNAATCNVDLGVLDPNDYCQSNPGIILPCYVYGDPLPGGSASGARDAVVLFDYTAAGLIGAAPVVHIATAAQVGTVWGTAYNDNTKKVFMAATVKRHAGLGPLGIGGLYVSDLTNPAAPVTTNFIDLTTIGINVGSVASNSARGLVTNPSLPSDDGPGFLAVAKQGIGGLSISDNGNKLYFTNLNDSKLYELDITAYNTSSTLPTAANVRSFALASTLPCSGGEFRAWGTKFYKGKVYVGAVCTGQTSQSKSDMRAYVYQIDPTTSSSTPIFDFPLTYPKGFASQGNYDRSGWYPWTDDFTKLYNSGSRSPKELVYPTPVFTDIEFDIDGSMVLGFGDRTAMQAGSLNNSPDGTSTGYYGAVGGDILRAVRTGSTFVMENNGTLAGHTGDGPNNNQGPGFGEFYNDNFIYDDQIAGYSTNRPINLGHAENAMGGLTLRPGSGEVIAATIDPLNGPVGTDPGPYFNSGGVRHLNNQTGLSTTAFQLYQTSGGNGTFAKASGLGDPSLTCGTPNYLEIGNYLWIDTNKDGVQDPCEKALAGVKVALYQGSTLVATTTTNALGEYYFNNNPVSGTATNTVSTTAILANTAYTVRFGTDGTANQYDNATGFLTVNGGKYSVTKAFATPGTSTNPSANTVNDSNAEVSGGFLSANVTTGAVGTVNHTIDAGFFCVSTFVASVSAVKATCTGTTSNNDASINLTGIQCADKAFLVASGGALPSYTATGSQPVSASAVSFTGLSNPALAVGQSYSVVLYNGPCCYTVVTALLPQKICSATCALAVTATPTVCNTATNAYSVTGVIELTNNTAGGTATVTDGSVTTTVSVTALATSVAYSLTGLVSDGTSHTVTVSLAGCGSAVATYSAPASCSAVPVCSLTVTASPTNCMTATNSYNVSGNITLTNNTAGGTATVSDGTKDISVPVSATATSVAYSLTGLVSDGASHTVTVTLTGCGSAIVTYTAPEACTVAAPALAVVVATPVCNTATNIYTATGTVSLSNVPPNATLTINDNGSVVSTTLLTAGQTTANFSVSGVSDAGSHTVVASFISTASTSPITASTTYAAPASCTVCSLSITTTMLPNGQTGSAYSQTLTTTGGTAPLVFSVLAGSLPTGLSLNPATGVISGTPLAPAGISSFTVSVSDGKNCSAVAPLTITTSALPVCSLSATATPTTCNTATNQYAVSGIVSATNAAINGAATQSLTITDGAATTVVMLTGDGPVSYTLSGLNSDGLPKTVTVLSSASACGMTSVTYTAPASCTVAVTAGLGDKVFEDLNANGIQDAGEPGINGVTVTLVGNGTAVSTTTANGGLYSFTGLTPGVSYSVVFTAPTGFTTTLQNIGAADKDSDANPTTGATGVYSLTANEFNPTVDAGYYRPASLGDKVFADNNNNGIQELGAGGADTPIPGVTVILYINGVASATTTTASSGTGIGCYSFTGLTPGSSISYSVGFGTPAGYTATTVNAPGSTSATDSDLNPVTGRSGSITLSSGEYNPTLDAGFILLPMAKLTVSSATVCAGATATLSASGCTGNITWSAGTTPSSGTSVTVSTAGLTGITSQTVLSYTATCTVGNSATTAVGTVTVNPVPSLTLTASPSQTVTAGNSVTLTASGCAGGTTTWSTGGADNGKASIVVMPVTGSNPYSATCTTPGGCTGSASIIITGLEPSSLVVTSATVCAGQTATLTAMGCKGSVSWSPGTNPSSGSMVMVSTTALSGITSQTVLSYTVTCTNGTTTTAISTVTVNPQPSLTITANPGEIVTAGSSVTLTATGCTGGMVNWSTGQQNVMSVVVPAGSIAGSTIYSATCITPSGCTDTKSIEIMTLAAACNLAVTATKGVCDPATNQYALTGSISATGSVGVTSVTVSSGGKTAVVSLSGNGPASYTIAGLASDGAVHVVSAVSSASVCGSASTEYTAPQSCSTAPPIQISVTSATVCAGTTATLSVSGCTGTVNWSGAVGAPGTNPSSGTLVTVSTAGLTGITSQTVLSYTATCTVGNQSGTAIGTVTVNPVPSMTLTASAPTCTGATSLTNGTVTLSPLGGSSTAGLTYQYSIGGTAFNPATAQPTPAATIPGNGQIVTDATEGITYWVQVKNQSGCLTELSVMVPFSNCGCPPPVCVPISVKRVSTRGTR